MLSLDRRRLLQTGMVALGGMPIAVRGMAVEGGGKPRANACILLYMDGGPSHLDLWDLKPEAPAEIRGPFQPIATSVPGVRVCEHLPLVARQMHHMVQIRSVCHGETVHDPAVYQMLTGYKHVSSAGGLKVEATDAPQMGAAFGRADRQPAAMPKVIELPETMKMEARVLPGQSAGFLGGSFDPFRVEITREAQLVKPSLGLRADISPARLKYFGSLVHQFYNDLTGMPRNAEMRRFNEYQLQTLALLSQPGVQAAFDLEREPAATHDLYGRNRHGQSVLLARRLVEAGVGWSKRAPAS